LRSQSLALEVSGHNLANLNTIGFRGLQTAFQSLVAASHATVPNVLNLAINNFGVLEGTHLDMTAGNLEKTGNPLDVAIEGTGFFAIQTARGTRFTRNGSFQVSSAGKLVTQAGDLVLSNFKLKEKGAITVPAGVVSIAPDGTLSVNGAVAGNIQVVDFPAGTQLTPEGESLFAAPEGSAQPTTQSQLKQGALESSNVNPISSIVTLIAVQREADMLQHCMSLFDTEFNQIASTELPKV
jgi:flagellar basal-body rod protein FlgF/flagellar basal-body rod protein FlgG